MPIPAQSILSTALITLQDVTNVRWTTPELLGYLSEGVRALIVARPDAFNKKVAFTPVAGARQALPAECVVLIDILGNTNGSQRAVTKVDMGLLSAINRDWQSGRQSAVARHFTYDERDPFSFYVYPPANGLGSIDLLHSFFPADLTSAGDNVPLNAQWFSPLLNFVLGKSYEKDAEYGGNAAAAGAYMAAFASGLSTQIQAASTVSPKS